MKSEVARAVMMSWHLAAVPLGVELEQHLVAPLTSPSLLEEMPAVELALAAVELALAGDNLWALTYANVSQLQYLAWTTKKTPRCHRF